MRESLQKLRKLSDYLREMDIRTRPDVKFHYITGQDDAANLLRDLPGIRVLVARPESRMSFSRNETVTETIETVFFVLSKDLDVTKTAGRECAQYDGLLEITEILLDQMLESCDSCCILAGLRITDATVRPEVKVFGSWNGYSLSLSLS